MTRHEHDAQSATHLEQPHRVVDERARTFAAAPEGAALDRVIGQPDLDAACENRWDAVRHDTLCRPYGLFSVRAASASPIRATIGS